jgi:hypothetical protein
VRGRFQRLLRPRLLVAVGAVLALIAGGLAATVASGLLFHDSSKPVLVSDALRRFRQETPKPSQSEGLYLYATVGRESLDVLKGAAHVYPVTTTISLTRVACGVKLQWQALEDRVTTWVLCRDGRRIALRRADEEHTFFGVTDHTNYICAAGAAWPTGEPPGARRAFTCRSAHDREQGVALMLGKARLTAGGVRVNTLHVRTIAQVSGRDHGTETVDWWLDPRTALPVRMDISSRTSRPVVLIGTAHYREAAVLRLSSLEPLR